MRIPAGTGKRGILVMLLRTMSRVLPLLPFFYSSAVAAPQQTPPPPVIRSTTRLVQLSVIVQNKKGEPITNLTKKDFTILDEGKPQEIAIFNAAGPPHTNPHRLLPPDVFTNRYDLKGQDRGTVTVILFDALNTAPADQSYVRQQILRFLQTIQPQDHVAVYALTTQLLILHEFTQDSSVLVNAVSHFTPKELAAFDASHPEYFDVPALHGDPSWMLFQGRVNQASAEIADQNKINRAETTTEAIEAIAGHVASIPGRKSLIWVSGGFPLQLLSDVIANDRQSSLQDRYAKAAAHELSRVDMAIYPVDASGVQGNASMDPSVASDLKCMDCVNEAPNRPKGAFQRQDLRDSERLLADDTGGQAFYGSNDIRPALHRAFDDDRYAYTIGFYPDHNQWDDKFRNVKIKVKSRDAHLRYRKGYFASPDRADPESRVTAELNRAAGSPVDATSLGMIVTAKPTPPSAKPATAANLATSTQPARASDPRNIDLHIGIDPKQLLLQIADGHRTGAVDLFFLQRDATGTIVAAEKQHVVLNLDEKQYEYLTHAAMVLDRHLTVLQPSTEIRIVLRDAASGTFGSVTLQVKSLFDSGATSGQPTPSPAQR
jgi:VWFA-related protein